MKQLWMRILNEPAFVGSLIIAIFDGLWVFDVITLTDTQFGWINGTVVLLFGAAVRQSAYGPQTGRELEAQVDSLKGELLDY